MNLAPRLRTPALPLALLVGAALLMSGCSLRKLAVRSLGSALASGTGVYASDDDPELVAAALPFGLKTIEALLGSDPTNENLLLAATSGFTQYSYAFVQQEADFVEAADLTRATELRQRARKLYLRALGYGWRALEVDHPGLRSRLARDAAAAERELAPLTKADVPLLYWTAAAWGAAISLAKEDAELAADLTLVEALVRRALALDEGYGGGALHDFLTTWEGSRASVGGSYERAEKHFERSLALSGAKRAGTLVGYAETVAVGRQQRAEFEQLLERALAIDPDAVPEERLGNVLSQKRARWLLTRIDELFIE